MTSTPRPDPSICRPQDTCRICGSADLVTAIDLGDQYVATQFVTETVPDWCTVRYPLRLVRCASPDGCGLVQLSHTLEPSLLYADYGYRSGINATMPAHLAGIVAEVSDLVELHPGDTVVDIGCNDGTLLSRWDDALGLDRIGFDPAENVAAVARERGLDVVTEPFTAEAFRTARGDRRARVVTSIAMFYDLPDPMAFAADVASILAPDGVWVIEMSYLPAMLENHSYDTVCHEHLEYYALRQIEWMLDRNGLRLHRVGFNASNGGSFRLFARPADHPGPIDEAGIEAVRRRERDLALDTDAPWAAFRAAAEASRAALRALLLDLNARGKLVHAYGASTKGNTILQYCGVDHDLVPRAADRNPDKWGRRTPGTGIEIVSEATSRAEEPDAYLVLPWHFRDEFLDREAAFLDRGGRFIFPLPRLEVVGREDL